MQERRFLNQEELQRVKGDGVVVRSTTRFRNHFVLKLLVIGLRLESSKVNYTMLVVFRKNCRICRGLLLRKVQMSRYEDVENNSEFMTMALDRT